MVYSTRRFVLCLTLCYFVLVFFGPFSITITSLGEERANLSAFRTFVRFALVWFCRFPLSFGVCVGLRFVIVTPWTFLLSFVWAIPQKLCNRNNEITLLGWQFQDVISLAVSFRCFVLLSMNTVFTMLFRINQSLSEALGGLVFMLVAFPVCLLYFLQIRLQGRNTRYWIQGRKCRQENNDVKIVLLGLV